MKKSTKLFIVVVALALLTAIAISLAGCNSIESELRDLQNELSGIKADSSVKTVEIIIGEETFQITTRKSFLHDALKILKEEGKISEYTYSGSDVNPFITAIGGLKQDFDAGKYYSVWHNVDNSSLWSMYYEDFKPSRGYSKAGDYGAYMATMVNEKELYYSSVGVGILPLFDGCTYAVLVD